jgi:hypothetical protein
MQQSGIMQAGAVRHDTSLLTRFVAKIVVDVLPAVLASVIGGFLISQYQFNHGAAPRPAAEQAAPASAEMVQLVRDEHAVIVDYIKAQVAAEKSRLVAANDADARAVEEAKAASASASAVPAPVAAPVPARAAVSAAAAAKPVVPRAKLVAAAPALPPHAQLVIAQAEQDTAAAPVAALVVAPAPQSKSLLAKTIEIKDGIKDHVVHATVGVVSAIGRIPSWIASMGDRIGAPSPPSGSTGPSYTAAS